MLRITTLFILRKNPIAMKNEFVTFWTDDQTLEPLCLRGW
jgi:hypothetical protein